MVIIPYNLILDAIQVNGNETEISISFISQDNGDAFVASDLLVNQAKAQSIVNGTLKLTTQSIPDDENKVLAASTNVLVLVNLDQVNTNELLNVNNLKIEAWVNKSGYIEKCPVQIIQVEKEIHSRIQGLYETDVLRSKTVLIIGVGSGGSAIAIELAKAGVGSFILVDHDRLEIVNLVRHACGISDLGRFKTKAVRDLILDKNPSADIETYEEKCDWNWISTLQELVKRSDLIYCGTDNRESRMLVNQVAVSERRVCIYGGTFNRAYGGHVLRVIPNETMCYQCFIDILPDKADDQEIANQSQADSIAYSDRPVAIEPGLASDIAPISIMCVKLGILELIRGTNTSLASLYEDLSNAWYQWLNRREADTDYADLKPLDSEDGDDFRILAWYGITNEKNPECPVCGDFVGLSLGDKEKLSIDEIAVFGTEGG